MKSSRTQSKVAQASWTALSVLLSFIRSLEMESGNLYLFSRKDLMIAKHIFATALKSEPSYFMWGMEKVISSSPYFAQQIFFNKFVNQGYDTHIFTRKLMIKNLIQNGIRNNGVKQVVILGGGYDPRALIASLEEPDVKFFELDRGQTRQNKLNAFRILPSQLGFDFRIAELGNDTDTIKINDNLYYIECDLIRDNLSDVLSNNGFRHDIKTLVIAEGLTMYLNAETIDKLLSSIRVLLTDGDQVILSFLTNMNISSILNAALKSSNELTHFSLDPDKVNEFVNEFNFFVTQKSFMEDRVGFSNDGTLVEFYSKNPKLLREQYYVIQKTDNLLEEHKNIKMDDVPDYVPEVSEDVENGFKIY